MATMLYYRYKKAKRGIYVSSVVLCVVSGMILAGCASVIPQKTLDTVDRTVAFKSVQADSARYAGAKVLFGGAIVSVENRSNGTYMEIMQQPLDSRLRPKNPAASEGRFIVVFDGFKDPAIYSVNRLLTVAGTVKGSENRPLSLMQYTYPLIEPVDHYLWPSSQESSSPGLSIGLGFGVIESR